MSVEWFNKNWGYILIALLTAACLAVILRGAVTSTSVKLDDRECITCASACLTSLNQPYYRGCSCVGMVAVNPGDCAK